MGGDERKSAGRQTQRERREATVRKLLDATIAAISEVGYARTSIQEICQRAGVSHGGLFRHFDTRLDLVVAAADEVSRRLVSEFRAKMQDRIRPGDDPITTALVLLKESTLSPLSAVWHEVLVASRTDSALRARFQPSADRFYTEVRQIALSLPGAEAISREHQEALLLAVLSLFVGAALIWNVWPTPDLDQQLIGLVRGMLHGAENQAPGE